MENSEREKYLKAYYDNEADANKQMSFANAFGGFVMLVIWMLYVFKVFPVHAPTYVMINIIFPISIFVLFSPLFYALKAKDKLRKPNYKYFVLFSFIVVIAVLNVVIPKHAMIGWALCIVMTNHYYNPKVGKVTFIAVMILMLICMYGGMFVGEYDANLLGTGILVDGKNVFPDGARERYNMLHDMLLDGENRYLKVFIYYYLARAIFISLIFFVSNALNKRTYDLLVSEIHVSSDQQRTKTELEVAKEIQLTTLPVELIANEEVEIQAELKAAKEVGGDFYDYFVLDKDHIAIVIGDVSGKGIPAAMFMMKTITCFKNYIALDKTPAEVLKLVNKTINQGNDSNMFVTCFLAIIDTKSGEVKFSNAGHNPPVVGHYGSYHFLKCNPGFVLGGFKEAFVVDEVTKLENGDTITLYTDGITEAMNKNREQYGEKRLLDLFNNKEYSCLIELHHTLKDDVTSFVQGADQSDDMTYLTLKYHGDNYVFEEKLFKGKKENIPEMLEFLNTFATNKMLEASFINNLMVVGDEMLSNIIKYGYAEEDGTVFIRLLYNLDKKEFVLTLIDTGKEFNPFDVDNKPVDGKDVSLIKEGGLGILIVKNMMSEYAYDRIYNKNIVILKKRFE